MLYATQAKNIEGTEKYFDTVLTQGDYYTGQEINGSWHGKAAELLGVEEGTDVTKESFRNLLRGLHPTTGKKLAQRVRKDRRPGVDLTFSVPKSVSLAWAINKDERILDVLRAAVKETMTKDVEPLVYRRLRTGKNAFTNERIQTGNVIYADFLHKTSRPVDGTVDPIGLAADHGIDDAGCFHDGEPRPGDRRWDQPTGPLDLDRHRARLGTALDLSTVPWAPTTVDADPDARTQLVLLAGARPTPSGSELLGSSAASGAWWSLRLVRVPPGATVDLAPTGTGRAGQVAVLGLGPDDPALLVEGASGWASVAGASAVLVPDEAIRVRNRSSHEVAALVGEPLPPAGRLPEGLHARLLWRRAGRDRWQQAVELAEAVS